MTEARSARERVEAAADAWDRFVAAREAMNAARPDPMHATKAEYALYDERYRADHEAEREHHRTAIALAQVARTLLADPDLEALRALSERASVGEWSVWCEPVPSRADAIAELTAQVHATEPFTGSLFLLDAGGKCPAATGCGSRSEANAAFIAAAVSYVRRRLAGEG
jgi:hypothetical protein